MIAILIITKWFLLLIFYSFVGWFYESIVCSVEERRLINRGFLNGPICPVYGFGALLVIALLYNRTDNLILLFFGCMVLTTALEYLTAILLEKLFHARWWDYTNYPFNFRGRICLLGAVVFGLMSTLMLRYLHPYTLAFLSRWEDWVLYTVAGVLLAAIACDLFITVRYLLRLNGRLQTIQAEVNNFLDTYTKRAEEFRNSLFERFMESEFYTEPVKKLLNLKKKQDVRLARAFPKLRPLYSNEAWQWLKKNLLKKDK